MSPKGFPAGSTNAPEMPALKTPSSYRKIPSEEDLFEGMSTGSPTLNSTRLRRSSSQSTHSITATAADCQWLTNSPSQSYGWTRSPSVPAPEPLASPGWYVDESGIHVENGMIYVTDIGVRPKQQAWFFLIQGCNVFDEQWNPVTVARLERELDPESNTDPIILRQMLWSTVSEKLWCRNSDAICQPGLNIDLITDYYEQRCLRTAIVYDSQPTYGRYASTSGAGILRNAPRGLLPSNSDHTDSLESKHPASSSSTLSSPTVERAGPETENTT